VPVYVNTFFEKRVIQLLDLAGVVEKAFSAASLDYRVAGGLATYFYVEEALPDAGRLTRDIDIVVRRADLKRIEAAVAPCGLRYWHANGVDMLVQDEGPVARRAVHMIFAGEKVKPEYLEPTPEIGECRTINGVRLVPLEVLVRMKLTSFRLKDQMHIKDLQEAGLITAAVEHAVPLALRGRLDDVLRRE
jgi:hypothetical protein